VDAILLTDGYKLDHRRQYPEGTQFVYSNWTPRSCSYFPEAEEGTVNEKGYKVLDSHVGMIYGDSITLERQKTIYSRLEAKGFAATNLVLGVGSYTYQYKSRDSLGFAMKATWCQVNGEGREIFKDPKTDGGVKKSLKGLIMVKKENGKYVAYDQVDRASESSGELKVVFLDGKLTRTQTISEIRDRVDETLS
jgi:nicotinamide phosphoribosyltransferase